MTGLDAPPGDELELYRRVRELVDRVTYKPGWRLAVAAPRTFFDRTRLLVEFDAPDARGSGRTVVVRAEVTAPGPDAYDEVLVEWLWVSLLQVEEHEAGEWFRVGGVAVRDPH